VFTSDIDACFQWFCAALSASLLWHIFSIISTGYWLGKVLLSVVFIHLSVSALAHASACVSDYGSWPYLTLSLVSASLSDRFCTEFFWCSWWPLVSVTEVHSSSLVNVFEPVKVVNFVVNLPLRPVSLLLSAWWGFSISTGQAQCYLTFCRLWPTTGSVA